MSPLVSVKSPNEQKPGMRMSTYGANKRRQPVDRYFFTDETGHNLRKSMHETLPVDNNQQSFDAENSIYS